MFNFTITLRAGDNYLVLTDDESNFVDVFYDYEKAREIATLILDEGASQTQIVRITL